jgi:Fe-S cluster assembly protein SufD
MATAAHTIETLSQQDYKYGFVTDIAVDLVPRGVFNGKIVVHKTAEKTDARQTNKTVVLSSEAVIDSQPQLEILNNDVQCTHGSTIGELDEDALFYLHTRGVDAAAARMLLTYAFVSEVLNRLTIESLRSQVEERLFTQLHARTEDAGVRKRHL